MFKRMRNKRYTDRVEQRFQTVITLIKDLDKKEFNRLRDGMALAWEAYNKVKQAKTSVEREVEDIEQVEKILNES